MKTFIALILLTAVAVSALPQDAEAGPAPRPNIILVVSDDQRADTMNGMPRTNRLFESGIRFTNAYATTPVCCPSRASIFTGQYPHNHGVLDNTGIRFLNPNRTIQRYLKKAGYRTALFGKYLNGWEQTYGADAAPPYIDDYFLGFNERNQTHPTDSPGDDFLSKKAVAWIKEQERRRPNQPWLLIVAAHSPHWPFVAEPRYRLAPVPVDRGSPALLASTDNMHPSVGNRRGFSEWRTVDRYQSRTMQYRMLKSLDDLVANVHRAVPNDERSNTMSMFTSDNGFMWGEWGMQTKFFPYQVNVRVPLMVRWPKLIAPSVQDRLVANIDIAPTILNALKIKPRHVIDGHSLLDRYHFRDWLLLENPGISGVTASWSSQVDKRYQFIQYHENNLESKPEFFELYNLRTDPYQVENLLDDGSLPLVEGTFEAYLSARLSRALSCRGQQCP